MDIQIDTREKQRAIRKIIKTFDDNDVKHFSSKLLVGDYMSLDNPRLIIDRKQNLQELCGNEFVLTERKMSYRAILDEALASKSMEIRPILEIGNPIQICELVKKSNLLSFLPDFVTEDYVRTGQVTRLPVEDSMETVWTQLLIHKNKWRSPAIHAFLDFYKDVMQKNSILTEK